MTTFADPQSAVDAVVRRLAAVSVERLPLASAGGRVLAEPVLADRPSPPMSVSAMDGYAVRLGDLRREMSVAGEVRIGQPPPMLPKGQVLKIVTGAAVPDGADAVIRREDVEESPERIVLRIGPGAVSAGLHIRRAGENVAAGAMIVPAGVAVTPAVAAALATFGVDRPSVYRTLRVGLLISGDELLSVEQSPPPWQIRDANGPALAALLDQCSWITRVGPIRAADDPEELARSLHHLLGDCDAVLASGGVSMGDRDYLPGVIARSGGEIVFHKLPVRPGKPALAAVGPQGQAIVSLPGNPVSAMVTACRLAGPMLRRRAGFTDAASPAVRVVLENADDKALPLWWWRLVRVDRDGRVTLLPNQGSGDIPAMAHADGFVQLPPGASGVGPWPMYRWGV